MVYTAYSHEMIFMETINVAGGGLGNGNTHAEIHIHYTDADMDQVKNVYYTEYGLCHYRKRIGDDVEWGEVDTFKILLDGRYVDED